MAVAEDVAAKQNIEAGMRASGEFENQMPAPPLWPGLKVEYEIDGIS